MKAYVLRGINEFSLEEIPKPVLKEGEVLLKVKAVGICGSDIPRIYSTGTYSYPLIPGHEFAGEVVAVYDEEDASLLGRGFGVFPLIPCLECIECRRHAFEMCRSYSYLGSRRDGGFAEYVAVPKKNLIALPEGVSYEAGAMLEPMAVAVHAIRRLAPKAGQTVAVCGLGSIGLLIIMFLQEMGIEDIIVFANHQYQRDLAVRLGVKPSNLGLKDRPIDMFFECVGSNETINWAVELTRPGGSVMLLGNPKSDIELPRDTYWKILRNQLTLMGTWNSTFSSDDFQMLGKPDDWKYALERVAEGRVKPEKLISHRLSFDEFGRGFEIMRDKSEDYTKVMAVMI